ncbi:alpha/beta hydrolase family protein [Sphingomonas montanisoli]|uniref:Alpha/beta fold hydrolase n=1 Tax=Sphingomonas montanisoli TaxID=2606412 RepID=A0A5D9CF20_9SPHN|nr:alpha/beta fold hydrolase [Sphingomonas montanisoli]TZG28695.1 alpha/beta fold hydrolase [Sphingomonas montanisoli]
MKYRWFTCATAFLLVAAPATAALDLPWTVPSENPVAQRAITFEHKGATLSGTLFYPANGRSLATAIVLHGAQAPLRSEPLYHHLTEMLPRLGMAVFVYDRRGSGESTSGGAAPGNFDLLAEDAVAAFATLQRDPIVDPARIGFWGLSQGGWLTIMAAAKEQRAAFAVAISAPMAAADVQMNFAVANLLRVRGYPQSVIDAAIGARTAVDDYTRGKISRAEAAAAEVKISGEPWYRELYLKGNIDDPEWKRQISADPLASLNGSRIPTLILFGQGDPWVPVAPSLAALRAREKLYPNVTTHVIDGADHGMMLGVDPKDQMDLAFAKRVSPNAPAYFALLAAWFQQMGLAKLR